MLYNFEVDREKLDDSNVLVQISNTIVLESIVSREPKDGEKSNDMI